MLDYFNVALFNDELVVVALFVVVRFDIALLTVEMLNVSLC